MQNDWLGEHGRKEDLADLESGGEVLIPAHSHIIGAWVYAGILGTVFWAYLFWLVLRSIAVIAIRRPLLAPVYAWLLVSYCWAIPFSPFGSTSRIIEAVTVVIIIDLLGKKPSGARSSVLRRQGRNAFQLSWRRRSSFNTVCSSHVRRP